MAILWGGTEQEAFDALPGNLGVQTGSTDYDNQFSRLGLDIIGEQRCNKVAFGDLASIWWHSRNGQSNTGGTATRAFVTVYNSSGVGVLRCTMNGSSGGNGLARLQYWNGSAWTNIGGSTFNVPIGINGTTLDMECTVDGTSGRFAFYVNGVQMVELTGDTDFFSGSAADYVTMQSWGSTNPRYWSESIIADVSTLGMRLATIVPNANGTHTTWTGTFADVDETTVTDSDFIAGAANTDRESFGMTNLSSAAAALTPVAVINSARARIGATGPQNLQLSVRTGGTDYDSPSVPGLTTSFTSGYQYVWDDNPNTMAAWTASEIDGLEIGDEALT